MNRKVIREISPEGISGLWRVGFMEKKGFEAMQLMGIQFPLWTSMC